MDFVRRIRQLPSCKFAEALDNIKRVEERYALTGCTVGESPFGPALDFDGNDDNVNIGDLKCLNSASAFTISFWAKQDNKASDRIFRKRIDDTHRIEIKFIIAGDNMYPYIYVSNSAATDSRVGFGVTDTLTWRHYVVVFDGSGSANADKLKLYIDGVQKTGNFLTNFPTTSADLCDVDARIGWSEGSWNGRMRNFVIFDRALTATEASNLYEFQAFDYEKDLTHKWDMSSTNPPDLGWRGLGYDGTGSNVTVSNSFDGGKCLEFNGNNSVVNIGDLDCLNSASAFSVSFWANQDAIASDCLFSKEVNATNRFEIRFLAATGNIYPYFYNCNSNNSRTALGIIDTVGRWRHYVYVFDGSIATTTERAKIYLDGVEQTPAIADGLAATTADLSGIDATIGKSSESFGGRLDEFQIHDKALTYMEVEDLYIQGGRV